MATKKVPLSTFSAAPAVVAAAPVRRSKDAADQEVRQKVFRLTATQDRELKKFCAHSDMTIQGVVMEGINLFLKKKGMPPL